MKKTNTLICAIVFNAAFVPVSVTAQQKMNLNFSTSMPKGGCIIGFRGGNAPGTDKPMKLEFSYRVRDGNMNTQISVNGWPKAQKEDPNRVVPMTMTLDTGEKLLSADGGYSSGFNDRYWAAWGKENSAAVFEKMKNVKTVHIEGDGMDFGSFDLQVKGLVYTWISDCAAKQKAAGQ
ncbi:hypothetical protein [Emcibacter nanhaiensis]|uniref:Uncharacterized protein n=1 Tax=Emcibacter nanhaiensis TaxID=1505037 RepID=A0A501P907_9PROT|nr:hypothetical protein [Emcibacter nanhaiensis]TPD56830.1 hypothetical protein FIV46_17825 [Emcibacter nanhaiensis]